uniref:Uncharacterized protein n=1 Tax=Lepeophtheirus salmonis TaxID=72036 RepID=A0A0K2VGP6_LEPSM
MINVAVFFQTFILLCHYWGMFPLPTYYKQQKWEMHQGIGIGKTRPFLKYRNRLNHVNSTDTYAYLIICIIKSKNIQFYYFEWFIDKRK